MRRSYLTTLLWFALLLCCFFSPAQAYLKSSDGPMVNLLTGASVRVELSEDFTPEEAENVLPGQEVDKAPRLQNTGSLDEYLLMKVQYVSKGDTAATDLKSMYLTLLNLNTDGSWTLEVNEDDYQIYCFTDPVAPGEFTTDLFTGVRVSSNWVNTCDFDVILTGAAIQSEGVNMTSEIAAGLFE